MKCKFGNENTNRTVLSDSGNKALEKREAILCEARANFTSVCPSFTPCGDKLIAIGANLQEIQLFTYRGFRYGTNQTGEELFNAVFPRCQTVQFWNVANAASANGRSTERVQFGFLSRECAFVTPDSRFLIVCASVSVPESKANFRAILQNNESLSPDKNLADITFYSVDLNKAQLVDRHKFDSDQITAQSGVYLSEWTLAILSVQHQTVHMVGIDKCSGQFVPLMKIGHSVMADDQMIGAGHLISPRTERCFTAFRQRFLTFLCKEHQRKGQMQQFLHHFDFFRNLKMQKLQFVGPELLLIRMDLNGADSSSLSSALPSSSQSSTGHHHHMFVLLEWRVGRIVGAFNRSSDALFDVFERHNEQFRNGHLARTMFPNSMEHCGAAREQHVFVKHSSLLAASVSDVRRRFLAVLPFANTQHFVSSPYLDPNLFNYDDKLVNLIEKGRYPPDQPLKIFSRRTKNLHTKLDFRVSAAKSLSYTRVLFHPIDPFVMSISRGIQPETLISFHVPGSPDQIF
uniref:Uncharacterized protein n=1 Tax=Globodera rostochiensis TaxID=31243 RepID=A0A914GWU4_GLORO